MAELGSFSVETSFQPNAIQLEWLISGALGVNEQVEIRKSLTTYPESPTDGDAVFTTTDVSITSHEDKDTLRDNAYYYYTIFINDTVAGTFQTVTALNRGFALSYQQWGTGDDLYELFPEETRSLDQATTGDLKRLSDVMGNMVDLYRSEVFVMEYNRKPAQAPDNILSFFSEQFGFPPERALDLNVLRRIAEGIVSIYKKKGTCGGVEEFVKLFTEFDSSCEENYDPNFKLFNGTNNLVRGTLTSVAANEATDSTAPFTADNFISGTFVDATFDSIYGITDNDTDTLFFNAKTPPTIKADSGSGVGLSDDISTTADNLADYSGTVLSGDNNTIVDASLTAFPDDYWNMSVLVMTSGARAGERSVISTFDTDNFTIELDGTFTGFVSPGDTYVIKRNRQIQTTGFTGLLDNSLAGRIITITGGTNSGLQATIVKNLEFGGAVQLVLSKDLTVACDNTSTFTIDSSGNLFQDVSQSWTVDEWRGYKLTVSGEEFSILTNTSDTLTVSPLRVNLGSPETYQKYNLDDEVTVSTAYTIVNQYLVFQGKHSLLFDDRFPPALRNSFNDLSSFLFGGTNRSIFTLGSISTLELPIVIIDAADVTGRSTNLTQTVLTDTSKSFTVNEFAGKKLNPNSQQGVDFTIVSNTSTTITVEGNLTLVSEIGNNYYVIDEEGSIKTKRLNSVIKEFVPHYLTPLIFHETGTV